MNILINMSYQEYYKWRNENCNATNNLAKSNPLSSDYGWEYFTSILKTNVVGPRDHHSTFKKLFNFGGERI